jgi:hypothetical protein
MTRDPSRRHPPPHRQHRAATIQEEQVEVEAHAKRVDARTARDQEAGAGADTVESAQAEQAAAVPGGDWDEVPGDDPVRKEP